MRRQGNDYSRAERYLRTLVAASLTATRSPTRRSSGNSADSSRAASPRWGTPATLWLEAATARGSGVGQA